MIFPVHALHLSQLWNTIRGYKESSMPSNQFQVRVQTTLDPPGLRLRAQATTASDTLAFESPGVLLTVLETEAAARAKIGVNGRWLRVRDANSREGYVAAWYVEAASSTRTTVERSEERRVGKECRSRW